MGLFAVVMYITTTTVIAEGRVAYISLVLPDCLSQNTPDIDIDTNQPRLLLIT